jgi:polyhydroxybutyrate depolymerase
MLLHGYGRDSTWQESYMQLRPLAESRGFLYCYPDGTIAPQGSRFWNVTDAAGDFWNSGVDDAGYLRSVIEAIARSFAVDRKRIHLVGHSNGGFMSFRLACESADLIASMASLAGATFLDADRCAPSEPVNILQIHGTADTLDPYIGGADVIGFLPVNMPAFPGAVRMVQIWAAYNGASDPVADGAPSLDLEADLPGLDTVITRYTTYPPGGAVELWTIAGCRMPARPSASQWLAAGHRRAGRGRRGQTCADKAASKSLTAANGERNSPTPKARTPWKSTPSPPPTGQCSWPIDARRTILQTTFPAAANPLPSLETECPV